jgi:hypothetical protein
MGNGEQLGNERFPFPFFGEIYDLTDKLSPECESRYRIFPRSLLSIVAKIIMERAIAFVLSIPHAGGRDRIPTPAALLLLSANLLY